MVDSHPMSARAAGSTRIHRLHLGQVRLPQHHPRAAERMCQVHGYVIEHPDGVIVVDTGLRAGHPLIDRLYAPGVVSIIDALNRIGIDERNVAAVVNTHLHFDHCGQNHLLGGSPVWMTRAELDASTTEHYTIAEWAFVAPDRLRLASDGESIADGVTALQTPGHTPGHLSLAVETGVGLEIIVGQACYSCDEFEAGITPVADMHTPAWHDAGLQSLARLHSLGPARAHFSHDATTFPRS